MGNLLIRKLADGSEERVKLYDPLTGQGELYTPEDAAQVTARLRGILGEISPTPRPLAGIQISEPPDTCKVSMSLIAQAKAEGWVTTEPAEPAEPVVRSAGPVGDPWGAPPHTFIHYDRIVFTTVDGDIAYRVVENPDKWPEEKDGAAGHGGEVRHYYELEREGG